MKPYRKRAYQSWNSGKGGKQTSDPAERQFSKKEIKAQLAEDEAAYLHRYTAKRKKNLKARLEYRVKWYQEVLERWARLGTSSSMDHYFREGLDRAKKDLAELIVKEKLQAAKIARSI